MKSTLLRRLSLVLGLLAILGVLAVACGEEEEEGPTPAAGTPAASPSAGAAALLAPASGGTAKIGGAGIASAPRQVPGLEGVLTLDDGLAAWKERPADEDRTGVSADKIVLGRNFGVTGVLASVEAYSGPGLQALIQRINEAGGIHGRKLELIIRDDQYNPTIAVQVVRELVEKDKVFGFFSTMGTATHQAVAPYIRGNKVLEFWTTVGDYGNFYPAQPFSFSANDPHPKNGLVAGEAVLSLTPKAKIAFVGMSGDVMTGVGTGIKAALEKGGGQLVAEISFDMMATDLTAQAVQAAAANPDWVIFAGTPAAAISLVRTLRQVAGYEGEILMTPTVPGHNVVLEASEMMDGVNVILTGNKDAITHPNDPTILALKKLLEEEKVKWNATGSPGTFVSIEALVRALEIAGPDLTKEGFVEAVYLAFDGSWQGTLQEFPMIYTPEDHLLDQPAQLARWNHAEQKYETLGPLKTYESSKGTGVIGNVPGFECQPPSAEHPKGTCPWKSQ